MRKLKEMLYSDYLKHLKTLLDPDRILYIEGFSQHSDAFTRVGYDTGYGIKEFIFECDINEFVNFIENSERKLDV